MTRRLPTFGNCAIELKSAYEDVGVIHQVDFAQSIVSGFVDSQ